MQILYLILFAVVLKVASCAWNDDGPTEYTPTFLIEPSQDSIKDRIKIIVKAASPRFTLRIDDTGKISAALISLAEEGSISTVEKFLGLLSKRDFNIPVALISLVIMGASVLATAKLLQTSFIRRLQIKYDVIRRDDFKNLLDYLCTQTDVLDGDCIVPWLCEISSSRFSIDRVQFDCLAVHANHEALKTAYDQLDTSYGSFESANLINAIDRINKRMTLLLTLFTQDLNTLPSVLVGIINTYITADA